MRPVFQRVAVLGLGLLGGSVALAAKQRGAAGQVVGSTRRADVLEEALRRGMVDEIAQRYEDAVRGADLVVLATPVFAMGDVVRRIGPALAEAAIVTDVGSIKEGLADTLPGLLPPRARYVGAHPMAGSHQRGLEHARGDLFEGSPCVVMEVEEQAVREQVAAFWRALGARVVLRTPARHDAEVGWMSHVPHVLAFAFAAALEEAPPEAFQVKGAGFRDFTRIAHSDPELWGDILTGNRKAVAAPLQTVGRALEALGRAIEADDVEAVERFIAAARSALAVGGVRVPDSSRQPEPPTSARPGGANEKKK